MVEYAIKDEGGNGYRLIVLIEDVMRLIMKGAMGDHQVHFVGIGVSLIVALVLFQIPEMIPEGVPCITGSKAVQMRAVTGLLECRT